MKELTKLQAIENYLNDKVLEMSAEIRAVLALLITKQHGFFLGVPGVGKSYLVSTLANDCMDVKFFKLLIDATTTPQEIFGPLNVKEITKSGKLQYNTEGFLPTSDVVFLDEMFKGNSQTLNANLTAMNEREFMNGSDVIDIPLVSLFAASNELPQDESLAALWDRFTVRMVVNPLVEKASFLSMLEGSTMQKPDPLTRQDLDDYHNQAAKVDVSELIEPLFDLRERMKVQASDVYVSDRRWKQVLKYIKGLAVIDGVDKATPNYFAEIGNCLWNKPEELSNLNSILTDYVSSNVGTAQRIFNESIAHLDILETGEGIDVKQYRETYAQLRKKRDELEELVEKNPSEKQWIQPVVDNFDQRFRPIREKYTQDLAVI